MAAGIMASNRCSMCQKGGGMCMCGGCKKFFCIKHFNEHRQQLSMQFDHEIVRAHDEFLQQINKPKQSNSSLDDLSSQIDQWETTTIKNIQQAAEQARQQLIKLIDGDRETLPEHFGKIAKEIRRRREEDDFTEDDIEQLRQQIDQLHQLLEEQTPKTIVVVNDEIDWNRLISIKNKESRAASLVVDIHPNTRKARGGVTVAGGQGKGSEFNQFYCAYGLFVDDDQTAYIADSGNHRILEWKCDATTGHVVAGGNGYGRRKDQLNSPTAVIVDKQIDSLIICDFENRRVVRWPRRGNTSGQTIIKDVYCCSLTMDDERSLYVSDWMRNEVRRWRVGETSGTVVAGGNGQGHRLNQLNYAGYVFVDRHHSVYVSDQDNHRVMKWVKGAKEGIIVAGGHGQGNALTQLSEPQGVVVDELDTVYVADRKNHRIMRWPKGSTQGSIFAGGQDQGEQKNQLNQPISLSFDRFGNLYVVEWGRHRVQRFFIDTRL